MPIACLHHQHVLQGHREFVGLYGWFDEVTIVLVYVEVVYDKFTNTLLSMHLIRLINALYLILELFLSIRQRTPVYVIVDMINACFGFDVENVHGLGQ